MNDSKRLQLTKYCINTRMGKYLYYFASEADAVIFALEAENERLREFILHRADHGHDKEGQICRYGEFTRSIDADGNAEEWPCDCGLLELQESLLNREQEKHE